MERRRKRQCQIHVTCNCRESVDHVLMVCRKFSVKRDRLKNRVMDVGSECSTNGLSEFRLLKVTMLRGMHLNVGLESANIKYNINIYKEEEFRIEPSCAP